ncbi:hypothetical protein GGR56DRAFT_30323 [Xylariaceae sp. FL0804]|nr:hypothetical protein GGR56DRAFT_30323 [Xylariaceae sp. FL0804]
MLSSGRVRRGRRKTSRGRLPTVFLFFLSLVVPDLGLGDGLSNAFAPLHHVSVGTGGVGVVSSLPRDQVSRESAVRRAIAREVVCCIHDKKYIPNLLWVMTEDASCIVERRVLRGAAAAEAGVRAVNSLLRSWARRRSLESCSPPLSCKMMRRGSIQYVRCSTLIDEGITSFPGDGSHAIPVTRPRSTPTYPTYYYLPTHLSHLSHTQVGLQVGTPHVHRYTRTHTHIHVSICFSLGLPSPACSVLCAPTMTTEQPAVRARGKPKRRKRRTGSS